jgi:DNA (cytosine-5)-methyltransferase 1
MLGHFARLVIESKADAFLFENVPSLLHPRNVETFVTFKTLLERAGYTTVVTTANAAQYGVAQTRQRVVMLGVLEGNVSLPVPTHGLNGHTGRLLPAVTAGTCLREFRGKRFAEREEVVSGRWRNELLQIPPGMNYKALSAWAGHPNPVFEAETRFWSFLLKLDPKRPSWTIAANPGPWVGPFHWANRRLRTVELAALQSFPADYVFVGTRRERVRQIGNAMPPLLAAAMVTELIYSLARR